jgi:uncharacterized protein (TIGR02246 family)
MLDRCPARLTVLSLLLASAATVTACMPPAAPTATLDSAADERAIREFLHHVEQVFEAGDLERAVAVFTDDAVIAAQGTPDAVGKTAIRELYAAALAQVNLGVRFHTEEIVTLGDVAYERGSYELTASDKTSGAVLSSATNRHIHVLKRQPDGTWKTWRMMTNSADAPPAP